MESQARILPVELMWVACLPFIPMEARYIAVFEPINGFSHLRPQTHIFDLLQRGTSTGGR